MLKLLLKKRTKEKENTKRKRKVKIKPRKVNQEFILFFNEIEVLKSKNYSVNAEFKTDIFSIKCSYDKRGK